MTKRERKALLACAKQLRAHARFPVVWLVPSWLYWEGIDLLPNPYDMPWAWADWAEIAESMALE